MLVQLAAKGGRSAGVTRPTSAHISGRSSAQQAGGCLDGQIRPERADDQRERPRCRLITLPETPRHHTHICVRSRRERSQRSVPVIGVSTGQSGSERSGAGSNRRPSAFQGFYLQGTMIS
jgi:hypothetical protein